MSNVVNKIDDNITQIETGLVKRTIVNEFGDTIGTFIFSPGDTNILTRLQEQRKEFEVELPKIIEQMANTEDESETAALLAKADNLARDFLNEVFDADVSTAFFGRKGVLSSVKGQFLIFQVIDKLVELVKSHSDAESEARAKRVEKHTSKYHN